MGDQWSPTHLQRLNSVGEGFPLPLVGRYALHAGDQRSPLRSAKRYAKQTVRQPEGLVSAKGVTKRKKAHNCAPLTPTGDRLRTASRPLRLRIVRVESERQCGNRKGSRRERGHQKEKGAQLCALDPYGRSTADGLPSAPVAHYFDKRQ